METSLYLQPCWCLACHRPHSLGQSVEWKQKACLPQGTPCQGPTRWGNQLNGNHRCLESGHLAALWLVRPHSLGQSVEWKLSKAVVKPRSLFAQEPGPHSLGQSVEWKHPQWIADHCTSYHHGPTRWGNQLNGNHCESLLPPDGS